jgi:hypothetical protein
MATAPMALPPLGNDEVDGRSERLVGLKAEHPLGDAVPDADDALAIDMDQCNRAYVRRWLRRG